MGAALSRRPEPSPGGGGPEMDAQGATRRGVVHDQGRDRAGRFLTALFLRHS